MTLNSFLTDTPAEYEFIKNFCEERGCEFALSEVWAKGGDGGMELAEKVLKTLETKESHFKPLYEDSLGIAEKIETLSLIHISRKLDVRAMVLNYYDNPGVSNVTNYLNIRQGAGKDEKVIGKLPSYARCV